TAAAHIAAVAADLDAVGAEGLEGETGDAADGLGDVTLPFEAGAAPIADLETGHCPVHAVQAAAADERLSVLLEQEEHEIGPLLKGAVSPAEALLRLLHRGLFACPRHPLMQRIPRVVDRGGHLRAIARTGRADEEPRCLE